MKILVAIFICLVMSACSTVQFQAFQAKVDKVEATGLADLQAAADRASTAAAAATDPGLKAALAARATYWGAAKLMVAAVEAQGKTCAMLIASTLSVPAPGDLKFAGPADALEAGAEKIGTLTGFPASVKLACEPLPLPSVPSLPIVPKF